MPGIKPLAVAALAIAIPFSAKAQTVQIALPNFTTGAIAVNPVTDRVYAVSNSGLSNVDDTVTVIDGKSNAIVANVSVPPGAYYPAVDLTTNKIYVASCNTLLNPAPCFVTVIDGKENTVVTNIPVVTVLNGFLSGIAIDPINSLVYVADNTDQDIAVINEKSNTLTGTISLPGEYPWGLSINPLINELYVALGTSQIDVVNTKTQKVIPASTGAGTVGFNAAVNIATGHVFVTNTQFGSSTTADLDYQGKLLTQIPVGAAAYGVDVDILDNRVFVANGNDNTTSVIDAKTGTVTSTIQNTDTSFVAVDPHIRKVYGIGNGFVTVATESTGTESTLVITPASGNFGNVAVGQTSPLMSFTVINETSSTMGYLGYANLGEFYIQPGTCHLVNGEPMLNPGQSCVFNAVFKPTKAGGVSGNMSIQTSSGTFNVPMSGTGVAQ